MYVPSVGFWVWTDLDRFGPERGYLRKRLWRSSQLRILRKTNLVIRGLMNVYL